MKKLITTLFLGLFLIQPTLSHATIIEGGGVYTNGLGNFSLDFVVEVDDTYNWVDGDNSSATGMIYSFSVFELNTRDLINDPLVSLSLNLFESFTDSGTLFGDSSGDLWEISMAVRGQLLVTIDRENTIISDLKTIETYQATQSYLHVSNQPIYEPNMLGLIALGLFSLGMVRRRNK